MNIILKALLVLLLAPVAGCLLTGLDRILEARFQNRMGPPLLQPFYDFLKLMSKENIAVSRYQNLYILFYFVFVVTSLIMLVFQMDLLMVVFVFTIANVALIAGGMSTGSPYSKIGSQREIMAMLAYEPILIFFVIAMYMLTGSFKVYAINQSSIPLIAYMPLIFISMLFIMSIKFKKSPFDFSNSHHAHQELVRGIMTEYSGPALAVMELTHWYETIFILGLMFIFWKQSIVMGTLISAFTFLFVIVVDNITARLTWQWMVKFAWSILIGLSVVNILGLYLLKQKIL
jgi:Formate hydrogenlyase subunit 4